MTGVNRHPSDADLHGFGWAMVSGFGVLGAILWTVFWSRNAPADTAFFTWVGGGAQRACVGFWIAGVVLLAVSYGPRWVARPVYVVWMTAAVWFGTVVVTPVVFTVLFIVVLPVFTLIRLRDPLRKKLDGGGTYWEDHKRHDATLERLMRPF